MVSTVRSTLDHTSLNIGMLLNTNNQIGPAVLIPKKIELNTHHNFSHIFFQPWRHNIINKSQMFFHELMDYVWKSTRVGRWFAISKVHRSLSPRRFCSFMGKAQNPTKFGPKNPMIFNKVLLPRPWWTGPKPQSHARRNYTPPPKV